MKFNDKTLDKFTMFIDSYFEFYSCNSNNIFLLKPFFALKM